MSEHNNKKYIYNPTADINTQYEFYAIPSTVAERYYGFLKENDGVYGAVNYIFNEITDNKYKDTSDTIEAGIVLSIVYLALTISGYIYSPPQFADLIDAKREALKDDIYHTLYRFIIQTQPSYTLEQLRQKTLHEILDLFVLAEAILGKPVINTAALKAPPKEKKASDVTPKEISAIQNLLDGDEFCGEYY